MLVDSTYQDRSILKRMVQSLENNHEGPELISPLVLGILKESDWTSLIRGVFTPEFSTFEYRLSQESYFTNRDYNNFILRCETIINTIINKRRAIFYTSQTDRSCIVKTLELLIKESLSYCLKTKENDPAVNDLKSIESYSNNLKEAIQKCESIKEQHIAPSNLLLSLPSEVQTQIFSKIPSSPQNQFEMFKFIESLYPNHQEAKLYREILPELINNKQIHMSTLVNHFSLVQLMQMAPRLHSISDDAIENYSFISVMPRSEFKSVRSISLTCYGPSFYYIKDLIKMPTLTYLSMNLRYLSDYLLENALKDLKGLKHLKAIDLTISTTNQNLNEKNINNELNMSNTNVIVYFRDRNRSVRKSFP